MKKFLSLLITAIFSFAILTGCGAPNMTNVEKSANTLSSAIESLRGQSDKLSVDSKEKYVALAEEIKEYVKSINAEPSEFDTQEKVDKITETYNDYISQIENLAKQNNIKLNYDLETAENETSSK